MTEQRLQEIENSIGLIDCPDCEQGRVSREGTFEDGQDYDRCETCDGSGMVSRFPDGHALIAEVRRLRQEEQEQRRLARRWDEAIAYDRERPKPAGREAVGMWADFVDKPYHGLPQLQYLMNERDAAIAERDAARQEAAAAQAQIDGARMVAKQMMDRLEVAQAALARLQQERDAEATNCRLMQDRLQRLIDGSQAWQQEREGLIVALRHIEWCAADGRGDPACPRCGRTPHEGHNAVCLVGNALAAQPTPPTEAQHWRCSGCGHDPHGPCVCTAKVEESCPCDGQPEHDVVCRHGVATDVHCRECHSGFFPPTETQEPTR